MAVYMSAGHRRRRTILIVTAGVVLGVVAGFLLGRATNSGIDDAVSDAKSKGSAAVTALSRLPIEYEQKTNGTGGESEATLLDSIGAAAAQLDDAFDAAPWLTPAQKRPALEAVASVRADVRGNVQPQEFKAGIDHASSVVARTFGVKVAADLG